MPFIPLPAPVSVAPFTVPANEPTYSQIFADTMGNAATPSDGFDQLFGALTALTDSVSAIPDLDAADVQAVGDNAAYFGTTPAGDLAAALQPASDATDASLGVYSSIVTPPPPTGGGVTPPNTQPGCKPGTVIGGVTIGKPDPAPTPTAPNIPGLVYHSVFNAMCVGDPPQDAEINRWTTTPDGAHWSSTKIWLDNPTIFSHYATTIQDNGSSALIGGHLVVNPVQAGRFSFVIEFFGTDVGWLGKKQFDVTIVKG